MQPPSWARGRLVRRTSDILPLCIIRTVGVVTWLICSYPPTDLISRSANLAAIASENVSFRYFLSLRLVEGPSQYTNPGQGPLLPLFQNILYRIVSVIDPNPAGTLIAKLNAFAHLTLLSYVVGLAVVIGLICSRRLTLTTWERIALLSSPIFVQYSWYHAYLHLILPDYYGFAMLTMLASAAALLHSIHSQANLFILSITIGLTAALKITLLPFAALTGAAIFLHQRGVKHMLLLTLVSVGIYFCILTAYYKADLSEIGQFIRDLPNLKNAAANNLLFHSPFFDLSAQWLAANSFVSIWIAMAIAMPFMLYGVSIGITHRNAVPSACFAAVTIAFVLAALRGQTTSSVDLLGVLVPATAVALAGRPHQLAWLAIAALAVAGVWTIQNFWFVRTNGQYIATPYIMNHERWNEEAYEWNRAQGLPIVFIMPSHFYTAGTAEDLIARGLRNQFGYTPDVTVNDNVSRKRWFGNYFFIDFHTTKAKRRYATDQPLPASYVVTWVQAAHSDQPLSTHERDAAFERYLDSEGYAALRDEGRCRSWRPDPHKIVFSCVAQSAEGY